MVNAQLGTTIQFFSNRTYVWRYKTNINMEIFLKESEQGLTRGSQPGAIWPPRGPQDIPNETVCDNHVKGKPQREVKS